MNWVKERPCAEERCVPRPCPGIARWAWPAGCPQSKCTVAKEAVSSSAGKHSTPVAGGNNGLRRELSLCLPVSVSTSLCVYQSLSTSLCVYQSLCLPGWGPVCPLGGSPDHDTSSCTPLQMSLPAERHRIHDLPDRWPAEGRQHG